ncbi:MAG: hypothetical protein J5833_09280 [Victivallales bacterium]|nr:hypothetical protein [Victivallales bacterium]
MATDCAKVRDAVFLSSRDSMYFYDVRRNGVITLFDEYSDGRDETPELLQIDAAGEWRWRGGYLPILQVGGGELFACGDELFVRQGGKCLAYPERRPLTAAEFDGAAAEVSSFWNKWLSEGIVLPNVSPKADAAWRSSLIQARCAFTGLHPAYGALIYRRLAHDSFPPTILSMCEALLQYGHVAEAIDIYRYYFRRFVRADGSLDYYGPSVAEYGAILWLGAMLMKAAPESAAELGENLMRMVRCAFGMFDRLDYEKPPLDAGLVSGSPEADERRKVAIYYHNNFQLLRGFLMLAPQMRAVGLHETDCELRKHALFLSKSLDRSFNAKKAELGGIPYSTSQTKIVDDIQSDRDAIYANYRYHLETLETGLLSREDALALIEYRERHNGEFHGMTLFTGYDGRTAVDNWPIAAYARGLLEYGERGRFMRLLDAQLNEYMSPGVFTAYEQETTDGDPRTARAPFYVPVQLAFPRMLAWSFCYTRWDGKKVELGGPVFNG